MEAAFHFFLTLNLGTVWGGSIRAKGKSQGLRRTENEVPSIGMTEVVCKFNGKDRTRELWCSCRNGLSTLPKSPGWQTRDPDLCRRKGTVWLRP